MRIAVAGIYHETNTFAPDMTMIEDFQGEWVSGKQAFTKRYGGTRTSMGGVLRRAEELKIDLLPGLYTAATPGGMVNKATSEWLFQAVVDSVDGTADGILLIMHGAMAAEGCPDVEGELLERLRARFGSDLPVAMTIDLHANVSARMIELSHIIVGYNTYPHIDMYERAEETLTLLADTIAGKVEPKKRMASPGMLVVPQSMLTDQSPMKELMDEAFAMERLEKVLNVTVVGGFPYSDVADAGMSFIVSTNNDGALAERLSQRLSELAWEKREAFAMAFMTADAAIRQALAAIEGPVILTEGSDNVGGGAPADATHVLVRLRDIPVPTLIVIRDADAARRSHELGVGGIFDGRIGGKSDELHGRPVPVTGRVRLLFDGVYHHMGPYMTGQRMDMGRTAVIECGKLTVVLTEHRTPPWDPGHVRSVGLRPEDFHIIVVKSAVAWQAAFGSCAKAVIHVDTPGCCASNLKLLPYRRLRRPIYPLDAPE